MNLNSELIDLIYNVPSGKSCWRDVLIRLRNEMHAGLALMYVFPPHGVPKIISTEHKEGGLWQTYEQYFWKLDPWERNIKEKVCRNKMVAGEEALDFFKFKHSEFYNDYWRYWGFKYTAGGWVSGKNVDFIIGVPRLSHMPGYDNHELRLLNYYVSHIKRAMNLEGITGDSLPSYFYQSALMSYFGLTEAEALLTLSLIKCEGLKAASNSLNRSYNTSKTQLASVFRKTKTHSQMGLLKRVMGVA